ncbi:hypothetical protein [Oceanobacillus halophilus]|uniref:hypothetical protein n=1 Tax=Oceanobacillus halophilus TaxID=930130 RepID=UPI0011C454EF|nr:hypothetical protein [Oceanobacillus halophilus]
MINRFGRKSNRHFPWTMEEYGCFFICLFAERFILSVISLIFTLSSSISFPVVITTFCADVHTAESHLPLQEIQQITLIRSIICHTSVENTKMSLFK